MKSRGSREEEKQTSGEADTLEVASDKVSQSVVRMWCAACWVSFKLKRSLNLQVCKFN